MTGLDRATDIAVLQPIQPGRPDLPVSAEKAIYQALSIDPADRFASIEGFKSALESARQIGKKAMWKFWG